MIDIACVFLVLPAVPAVAQEVPDFDRFPYTYEIVPGYNAEWAHVQRSAEGGGQVFIAGDLQDFTRMAAPLIYELPADSNWQVPDPQESLAKAEALTHPEGLFALRAAELQELKAWIENNRKPDDPVEDFDFEPVIGEWPVITYPQMRPTLQNHYSGAPHDEVYLVSMGEVENAAIPALLSWGGWNANPMPEYHVAALRSWHERYGATLIGLTGDAMELRVERRPETREEALTLAREMYAYCNDIVDQGTGDLAGLAAILMVSDIWYFWWD